MAESNGRLRAICPVIPVRDVEVSAAFYARHLGFKTVFVAEDRSYAVVARDGQAIHLTDASQSEAALRATANNISFYIETENLDALWAEVEASQPPTRIRAPEDKPWGVREFHILDHDGALLRFGQDIDRG